MSRGYNYYLMKSFGKARGEGDLGGGVFFDTRSPYTLCCSNIYGKNSVLFLEG